MIPDSATESPSRQGLAVARAGSSRTGRSARWTEGRRQGAVRNTRTRSGRGEELLVMKETTSLPSSKADRPSPTDPPSTDLRKQQCLPRSTFSDDARRACSPASNPGRRRQVTRVQGPQVVLDKSFGAPTVTKDGVPSPGDRARGQVQNRARNGEGIRFQHLRRRRRRHHHCHGSGPVHPAEGLKPWLRG